MIVDLGIPAAGHSFEDSVGASLALLPDLKRSFAAVAVSFEHDGTRVSVWPGDNYDSVLARWKAGRKPGERGYVGRRRLAV